MKELCDIPVEKLPFMWGDLCLQEPMAFVTNSLIAIISFYAFVKSPKIETDFFKFWRFFFLVFAISTFFSGFAHVFFQYLGYYGKYFVWLTGLLSAFFAGLAMLNVKEKNKKEKRNGLRLLILKFAVFALLALVFTSFTFVMIDAALTYLIFCLGYGVIYYKQGMTSFKYMIIGVLILLPSIFIFTLNINPHLWFNKEDLSHLLMMFTVLFFHKSIVATAAQFNKKLKENGI